MMRVWKQALCPIRRNRTEIIHKFPECEVRSRGEKMKPRFLTMFLLIFTAAAAFGQQGSSTITGTITDPSGANVAGAAIVATATETGATRSVTSQATGAFRLDALRPGNYILKVEFTGFKTLEMKDINLFSSETRDVGKLVLAIGQLNQMVEVTAQVTPVQTASSERAELVSSDQLERLTIKGRDPYSILNQVPGVISTRSSETELVGAGSMSQISINGNDYRRVQSNVDGTNTNHLACNCVSFVIPNLDAISEVRVLTNGNQAEYGRGAGGIINFVTKSGTSQFHGSAHWEKRHENLNANSFMNNRSNIVRPIYRYGTLGGSIGGPAYIPRLMPSSLKNKFSSSIRRSGRKRNSQPMPRRQMRRRLWSWQATFRRHSTQPRRRRKRRS